MAYRLDGSLLERDETYRPMYGICMNAGYITTITDVELDVAGNGESGTEIIPAGTEMTVVMDNYPENRIILQVPSTGHLYSAEYDDGSYPLLINGVPEDELFEGMFYAA